MSTLNSEMQQQVVDANNVAGGGAGALCTTNNSVASDSGIESSAGASNSNAPTTTIKITNEKNTVSAAADSSDNQPSTPQPQPQNVEQQQPEMQPILHQPYAENTHTQQIYANTTNAMYPNNNNVGGMYGGTNAEQQPNYGNFINNFDTYYQQQQQQPPPAGQQNFPNNGTIFNNNNNNNDEFKRYHPYTIDLPNDNNNKLQQQHINNTAVSTTRNISPNLVSSSSPTSTSAVHMSHYGANVNAVTPNSPNGGNNRQCKKCGIMCSSESELQEHVSNVHGSSPYGSSSGYSSSPFIKEDVGVISTASTNTGDILDLDSQKMVYPHELPAEENPLHSMHTMQQRALPAWEQASGVGNGGGVPVYYANKPNINNFGTDIKQDFMKPDAFPDNQQYINNTADISQQQQQQQQNVSTVMSIASPVEFPSTTTAEITQEMQQQQKQPTAAAGFRNPTTNGNSNTGGGSTTKPSAWKSNEARRPKTYNCTACNKWFTSSGHLKRHYNTTLHKNAVKSSNQPDPATLPISAHHHPARDPNSKHNRRNSQQAQQQAQQQQAAISVPTLNETPVSPTDYASISSQSAAHLSNYSTSPSPTTMATNGYQHQFIQQQQQQQTSNNNTISPILSCVASPTTSNGSVSNNLNGHPNALAGPSVPITATTATLGTTMSSSQMRGLLNTTIINWLKNETSTEEDATVVIDKIMDVEQKQLELVEPVDPMKQAEDQQQQQEFLEHQQLVEYHTNNSNSKHTICHQAYLEPQQMAVDNNCSPITPIQSPQQQQQQQQQLGHLQIQQVQQQQQQQHIIQHLDINNMQQQQQSYITHIATTAVHPMDMQQPRLESPEVAHSAKLGEQLQQQQQQQQQQEQIQQHQQVLPSMPHCHTLLNNTNMVEGLDNIHMQPHTTINMQQQPHMQRIINMHTMLPLTTITAPQLQPQHTHTQLLQPHTTNTTTTTIPCFQQLQQQASGSVSVSVSGSPALVPLEPTMTYHTIIGNNPRYNNTTNNTMEQTQCVSVSANDYLQLTSTHGFDTYANQQGMQQQLMTNNDIQILQLVAAPQTSYITFPTQQQQQQQQQADNDENDEHLLSFIPMENMENMETSEHIIRVASTESAHRKTETFAYNDDSNNQQQQQLQQQSADENNSQMEHEQNLTKKKSLKRKRRQMKNKTMLQDDDLENDDEEQQQDEVGPPVGILLPSGRIQCPECPKTFTKPCYLTQHMKIHAGKCPFRCTKCGKRYKVEDVFKEHVARHGSTNKPHKCHTCEKQFHHKTDLRRHIEVIHKNEKKHVCYICPKGFCRNDHLLKHIETHFRTRITKDKIIKEPKVIQPRKKKRTTSDTNFEQNTNSTTMQEELNNIAKNLNDNSEDTSPLVSIDEDDDELLQIPNHHRLMLPQQQLPHAQFHFREIPLF